MNQVMSLLLSIVMLTVHMVNLVQGQETSLCGPSGEWILTNTTLTNTIPARTDITLSCTCAIEPMIVKESSDWGISIIPLHVKLATTRESDDETLSICPSGGSLCDASTGYLRHSNPDPDVSVTLEGPLIKFTRLTVMYKWKGNSAERRGIIRISIEGSEKLKVRCTSNLSWRAQGTSPGAPIGDKPTDPFLRANPSSQQTPQAVIPTQTSPTNKGNGNIPLLHLILAIVIPICVVFVVAILAVVICLRRNNKLTRDEGSSQNYHMDGPNYSTTASVPSKSNLGLSLYHYNDTVANLQPAQIVTKTSDKNPGLKGSPYMEVRRHLPFQEELAEHLENLPTQSRRLGSDGMVNNGQQNHDISGGYTGPHIPRMN